MKKFTIASILALAAFTASATEIAVSGIRDTTRDNVTGSNISVTQPVTKDMSVSASFENVAGKTGTNTDTFGLGVAYNATTVGPFTLTGLGGIGFNDSAVGKGSFVKFGAQASTAVPFVKDTTASLALVRQLGTSAVTALDHTEAIVGVRYQATKAVSVNGSATVYNATDGSKMALGVAYAF